MADGAELLYDSFGNYIGPDLDSDGSDADVVQNGSEGPGRDPSPGRTEDDLDVAMRDADPSSAVVLADDKQVYPKASQVFGPDTEAMVEEEDTQRMSEPLVAPKRSRVTVLNESGDSRPRPKYDYEYFAAAILPNSSLCRNVAVIGNLHHGKTTFCDMLFRSSHEMPWDERTDEPPRYMDSRLDEQKLQMSVKTNVATLLLPSLSGKSYGITVLDAPGHPNFMDEAVAALNLADGAAVFVDCAEGVGLGTELLLRKAVLMRVDIVLVVSKLDRLILELRMPPADAYHKIRHTIDAVNDIIVPLGARVLSPARGNVVFSAATEEVCFSLPQFAAAYVAAHGGHLTAPELAKRLWGDAYYHKDTRTFVKKRPSSFAKRTFVEFVLDPLYKLHTAVVSDEVDVLTEKLARNSINLSERASKADVRALLRTVLSSSFGLGSTEGFVDMVTKFVDPPQSAAPRRVRAMGVSPREHILPGDRDWVSFASLCLGDRESPMIGYVGKLAQKDNENWEEGVSFRSVFKILSGLLRLGDRVRVLGDDYHVERNDEEQASAVVEAIALSCGRFAVDVKQATAGQIVLVDGIDETVFKSATVVAADNAVCDDAGILRPLPDFLVPGVLKIAVEPVRPSELPKMIAGLRMCLKSYPGLSSKVEESGEHVLLGPGELYMDCVMRDLRETFAEIEIKVSDPVVPFAETVTDMSALQCNADTPNKQNKVTMMAEPLEEGVAKALRDGRFARKIGDMNADEAAASLRSLGWDSLSAKSLWAFGPHATRGPNALLNDIVEPEVKQKAASIRDAVVQGFKWAMREGPLTDEPVRGAKFRLLDAAVSDSPIGRSPAQIIPAARRAAYSSILTASPRLLEPVYLVEVTCPQANLAAVYTVVQRRRGTPLSDGPVPGTPLFAFRGLVPVLDSFGLEADVRGLTLGAAHVVLAFDHWGVVPGDPLDRGVALRPLEPAGRRELARECMVKTRRRKGMPDDVSVVQYFDDPAVVDALRSDPELAALL